MPFEVIERMESLPLDGRDLITIPGVCRSDFVICEGETVRRLIQVTWDMSGRDESSRTTRKREVEGLIDATESLGCEDLTIITHDEEGLLKERGHDIRVIPAWKWCLGCVETIGKAGK